MIFNPKNKSFYKGKHGRLLMSHAGRECKVQGTTILPANQTQSGKDESWVYIRFNNSAVPFMARPIDIDGYQV